MKTPKNLTLTMFSLLMILKSYGAIFNTEASAESKHKQVCTRTILRNGELVPFVQLPEIVISGERSGTRILGTTKGFSGRVPVIDLPEVVITDNKIHGTQQYRTAKVGGSVIPVIDLPELVISAEKMFTEIGSGNENSYAITFYKGHYIPVVNLPAVEISAEKEEKLFTEEKSSASDDSNKSDTMYSSGNADISINYVNTVYIFRKEFEKVFRSFLW